MSTNISVAVWGTGLMGFPLAIRLRESGYPVFVYNRTLSKADPLRDDDIIVASTAGEAARQADVVIVMLSDAQSIHHVMDADGQLDLREKIFIQMGTISPDESRALAQKIEGLGARYLECPVLGSRKETEAGQLILMAGGTRELFEEVEQLLKCLGEKPELIGEVGSASVLKLALNQLIASLACSFSLSLGLVQREGIPVETYMNILRFSALYAPMFDKKLSNLLGRNFQNPNFPAKHLLKDVNLVLDQADKKGLAADHLKGVKTIIERVISLGLQDEDYSVVHEVIAPSQ